MNCLALFDSGNYAISLCNMLERKGYVFEVVSLPCRIAKSGCGYCMKLPVEYVDMVVEEGMAYGTPVREVYKIVPELTRNRYEKIY
jgi:hypothetical protein